MKQVAPLRTKQLKSTLNLQFPGAKSVLESLKQKKNEAFNFKGPIFKPLKH